MELTGKQKRQLRGLGHDLRFTVQVGQKGVTPTVVASADAALGAHELIKVKFIPGFEGDLGEAAAALAAGTHSAEAGRVGRTVLLYRRHPDEPRIELVD